MASEGDEHHHHHHHHHWWDVFLSFAGEDTRNGFVDHLYSALEKSWILTFKDDEKLERGEPISHTLLKAIEESMVAVVVFSKNYASSRWCLDELVKIMDCGRRCSSSSSCNSSSMRFGPKTVVVIPIFYHVDPSHVRNPIEKGYFGGDIISGQHDPAQVEIWRKALEEAGNLAGHVVNDTINSHEAKFIGTLVKEIWRKLPDSISSEERLFGMESRIKEVISLLDAESDAVRFVGVWGLSGIGKTTLAKAIFHRMRNQFQVACFLEQVGEEGHGLRHLEKQQGAENIECILLHPSVLEGKCMEITTKALRKMPKLRLLVVRNVRSRQAPKYLLSELRWLIWNDFPSESLPPKAYNLVGLELHHNNIKRLWKRKEMMDKLTYIDLSHSPLIESTPDFTSTPNLEGQRADMNDWCEMEVSIENSRPNTARVTKWGMGLVPKYQTI